MRVIGVIDLLGGQAVHARGGRRQDYRPVQSKLLADGESGDATALARAYRRAGISEIYLADLDAIAGRPVEAQVLRPIGAEWIDAGVRDLAGAAALVEGGTQRIVLALETLSSWDLVEQVVALAGSGRTAFSVDLRGGAPLGSLGDDPVALAGRAVGCGVAAVIVLDLARVGASVGVDRAMLAAVRAAVPAAELVVGGGIRDASDVAAAAESGCDGVLVGTALHTGSLPLPFFTSDGRSVDHRGTEIS
jgi:phosphoribosylformimino-5-aminoimidazole carboxamide ribotide isomerase